MKKNYFRPDLLKENQISPTSADDDKAKTTDINILLNRVRLSQKMDFKKRLIFSSIILLFTSLVAIFFLFK